MTRRRVRHRIRRRILRKWESKGLSPRSTMVPIMSYIEGPRAIVLEYEKESRLYVLTYRRRIGKIIARHFQIVFFNQMDAVSVYWALEKGGIE